MNNNAITDAQTTAHTLEAALQNACGRIAPTWPLDQFVAVNPLWEYRDQPISKAVAMVAARGGARVLPSRRYFQSQWDCGRIGPADLDAASKQLDCGAPRSELIAHLQRPTDNQHMKTVADQLDASRNLAKRTAWTEEVVHQISQLCASEFDLGQGDWPAGHRVDLYRAWRYNVVRDRGIAVLMGTRGLLRRFDQLPEDADTLVEEAIAALGIPDSCIEPYLHALLLSINGWASWCAYQSWQANLAGDTDPTLRQLLAIRLAWDWVLFDRIADESQRADWQHAIAGYATLETLYANHQAYDWVWQRALEHGYQQSLIRSLKTPASAKSSTDATKTPSVQAAFCIDVRSEVFRRKLEHANPSIHTLGFAGFFGAPVAYQPLGVEQAQPRLPGLLSPSLTVVEQADDTQLTGTARMRLRAAELVRQFRWGNTSMFSYVEATGLLYGIKLIKDGVLKKKPAHTEYGLGPHERSGVRQLLTRDGNPLSVTDKSELAAATLQGMSLTHDFASLVILVGHVSETRNNPHASSLDCGACCGRSGEINARVVAELLNEPDVRAGLRSHDIDVPDDTRFIGALHNTTTDGVSLFPDEVSRSTHDTRLQQLQTALDQARRQTNAERAPSLSAPMGIGQWMAGASDATSGHASDASHTDDCQKRLQQRTRDWSQVRPEWGLAGNASMVVAPRARTRGMDLGGRAFLHEYIAAEDKDNSILELIMTAPMIVAQWINFQYYASTVDNRVYGSGNKVLHNIAGGHIGVFEGNGGDLRIGLSLQSLHDGEQWIHEPLRLSVFIQASTDAIARVIAAHDLLAQLIENQWLFIFQIGAPDEPVYQFMNNQWHRVDDYQVDDYGDTLDDRDDIIAFPKQSVT